MKLNSAVSTTPGIKNTLCVDTSRIRKETIKVYLLPWREEQTTSIRRDGNTTKILKGIFQTQIQGITAIPTFLEQQIM
jgi:hypothetical protein